MKLNELLGLVLNKDPELPLVVKLTTRNMSKPD